MILTKKEDNKIYFSWSNDIPLGYAYKEVDGYYVFIFEGRYGFWREYSLKAISDKLIELNKDRENG